MSIAAPSVTLQYLITVIKRFKFEEMETAVMPHFPEISWSQLKADLVKEHKRFNTTNVAMYLQDAMIRDNVQEKVLSERSFTLEVIEVSQHHRKRMWHGYALVGSGKTLSRMIDREIQQSIKETFHSENIKVDTRLATHNGITFLCLREEKKGHSAQRIMPTYFAFFLDQKYFFCSKKTISPEYIHLITLSIGYKSSKKLKLIGRDLLSLSKLCWRKKQGVLNPDSIDQAPIYVDALPDIKPTGVDYTQSEERRKFAEKCFGIDPPTLEVVVVNAPNQPWKSQDVSTKLPNENIDVTWEYRSHNITNLLTKLIERRILVTPVPYYISNLTVLGKNILQLKHD